MYKNIIFDIGKVLLNFEPEEYLKSKIEESSKVKEVHKALFQSKEWIMLDRGTITEEEAKKVIAHRNKHIEHLIEGAFENWYDILTPIEGTVKILEELKNENYKVYFLSNFHLLAFEEVTKKHEFFKLFDGGIVSYKEKAIKPEEKIYKRLIEEYKLNPEESIFIDDVQANLEGAKRLNFNTILFKDSEDLRERLRVFNIQL